MLDSMFALKRRSSREIKFTDNYLFNLMNLSHHNGIQRTNIITFSLYSMTNLIKKNLN